MKFFLFLFLLLSLFIRVKDAQALAANDNVVINEVYAASSSEDWIEIYNLANEEIDLKNWKLLDLATTPIKIISDLKLPAKGFIVFSVGSRLNNNGDTVKIVDDAGNQIDSFSYTSTAPNRSFARLPDGVGDWLTNQPPTKGESNNQNLAGQILEPLQTADIQLSEFMANPDGGDEWAEVYNPTNLELDISGWKIDDQEGASSPHTLPTNSKISPFSYKIISFSAKLNNSGDTIRLIRPDGTLKEQFTYQEVPKAVSFAKDKQGSWKQTSTPTPGSENIITSPIASYQKNNKNSSLANKLKNTESLAILGKNDSGASATEQASNYSLPNISPDSQAEAIVQGAEKNNLISKIFVFTGFSSLLLAVLNMANSQKLTRLLKKAK